MLIVGLMQQEVSSSLLAENLERLLCLLDVRLNAVGLCQVSTGWRLKLPPKKDVLVHYILKGEGILRMPHGAAVPFRPDTLIFIPPGLAQELSQTGFEFQCMDWKDTAHSFGEGMVRLEAGGEHVVASACGVISAECGGLKLFEHLREPLAENVSEHPEVGSAFELMLREFQTPRFGSRALSEALMKQALLVALRLQIERADPRIVPLGHLADPRLVKALVQMLESPAREYELEDLARISGMSRSLFSERFTEAFGRPPMVLLKNIRLRRAASLLRETNLPIQIVSTSVGFGSRSYFSRAFRAEFGMDPKTMRQSARGQTSVADAMEIA